MPSQEWCKTGTVCRRYTLVQCQGRSLQLKKNNDCARAICLYSRLYIMVLFCNSRMYLWEIPLCYIEPSVNLWYTLCLLYKIFIEDQFKIYVSLFCNKSILKDLDLFLMTWDWFVLMVLMVSINFGSVKSYKLWF